MNAILFYKNYGITGLLLYLRLKLWHISQLRLPNIKSIIYLRPNTSDREVFDQIFLSREYELAIPFVPKMIIDGGANIGLTSVFLANKYKGATILAIEPERSNFRALVQNASPYENIIPIRAALWHEKTQLQIRDVGTGEWGFVVGSKGNRNLEPTETITIQEVLEQFELSTIDLLKIDIEGAEKELFSSNYETWLPKVRCIVIELHDNLKPGTSKSVFRTLDRYHFSFSLQNGSMVFLNEQWPSQVS